MMSIAESQGSVPAKRAGMMAKYFATSMVMEKVVRERPVSSRSCFADFNHLDQFRRIAVEVDQICRPLWQHPFPHSSPGRHRLAQGLARHWCRPPSSQRACLRLAIFRMKSSFIFGRRFGKIVLQAGLLDNRRGRPGVIASDHDEL